MQTGGRTDEERKRQIHYKANSRFRSFVNAPKNRLHCVNFSKTITLCQFQQNNYTVSVSAKQLHCVSFS